MKSGRIERRRKTEDGLLEIKKEDSSPPQALMLSTFCSQKFFKN